MTSTNKKVLNASPKTVDGIKFKSTLESTVYKTLLEYKLSPKYESTKYTLVEGTAPQVPFYKDGVLQTRKILKITYTPDFIVEYNRKLIFIEVKGWETDIYPLKRKLFRLYLESNHKDSAEFWEIHTKRGLIACLNRLTTKNYDPDSKNAGINKISSRKRY